MRITAKMMEGYLKVVETGKAMSSNDYHNWMAYGLNMAQYRKISAVVKMCGGEIPPVDLLNEMIKALEE